MHLILRVPTHLLEQPIIARLAGGLIWKNSPSKIGAHISLRSADTLSEANCLRVRCLRDEVVEYGEMKREVCSAADEILGRGSL
jgi:hypothetical protein